MHHPSFTHHVLRTSFKQFIGDVYDACYGSHFSPDLQYRQTLISSSVSLYQGCYMSI